MTVPTPRVEPDDVPPGGIPTIPETGAAPLPGGPTLPTPDFLTPVDEAEAAESFRWENAPYEPDSLDVNDGAESVGDPDVPPDGFETIPES